MRGANTCRSATSNPAEYGANRYGLDSLVGETELKHTDLRRTRAGSRQHMHSQTPQHERNSRPLPEARDLWPGRN